MCRVRTFASVISLTKKTKVVTVGLLGALVAILVLIIVMVPSTMPTTTPTAKPNSSPTIVQSGQYELVSEIKNNNTQGYAGASNKIQVEIVSNSSSHYITYVMNLTQFNALGWTSNSSGRASQTTAGAGAASVWSSGSVTSTAYTLTLGNGDWFIVLYNSGANSAAVNVTISTATG
jgi:hypothetical protein